MNFITKKGILYKLIIVLSILAIGCVCILPNYVYAEGENNEDKDSGILGTLLKEILNLIAAIGDIGVGALSAFMVGTDWDATLLTIDNANLDNIQTSDGQPNSWLVDGIDSNPIYTVSADDLNGKFGLNTDGNFRIPNILYSPDVIFSNDIAALDVNFLNPNKYWPVIHTAGGDEAANKASESAAADLQSTISTWYKTFRNIAIVLLLTILVYIGIRILISSTAPEKSKYKELLKDWFVALCLVFIIHIIMSCILLLVDQFNNLFKTSEMSKMIVEVTDIKLGEGNQGNYPQGSSTLRFRTNLTGLIRFKAQLGAKEADIAEAATYTILYLAILIYTCIFTFMYFKRFLYVAFLTMISPLVAITYPIDRAGDGQAQAFNMWFKEYTMQVIIQPVHLILYTALVSSSIDLVARNPLYALVAIAFLIPAEKFIKQMFGLNKANSTDDFGSFAGGALAMSAINKLGDVAKNKVTGSSKTSTSSSSASVDKPHFFGQGRDGLSSFNTDEKDDKKQITTTEPEDGDIDNSNDKTRTALDTNNNQENFTKEDQIDYKDAILNWNDNDNIQNGNTNLEDEISQGEEESRNEDLLKGKEENANSDNSLKKDKGAGSFKRLAARYNLAKNAQKFGKKAFKAVAIGAGATTLGAMGLAAGLTTGDPSKVWQYTAGAAGVGAGLGSVGATGAMSLPGKFENMRQMKIERDYRENKVAYGEEYALQQKQKAEQELLAKQMRKDSAAKERADRLQAKLQSEGINDISTDELMNAFAQYKTNNIDNDEVADNAIFEEARQGNFGEEKTRNQMMDVANLAQNYGKEYIEDDKKRSALQSYVRGAVNGNEETTNQVMGLFSRVHGVENRELENQRKERLQRRQQTNSTQENEQ